MSEVILFNPFVAVKDGMRVGDGKRESNRDVYKKKKDGWQKVKHFDKY